MWMGVAKILGVGLPLSGLTVVVASLTIFPETFGVYPHFYIYGTSSTVNNGNLDTEENFKKGVQCKFKNEPNTVFDCDVSISKTEFATTKQYKIKNLSNEFEKPAFPQTQPVKKIMKVGFSFKDWKTTYETKEIEIITKGRDTTNNKIFFDIKPIACIHDNKKTNYLIARSPDSDDAFTLPAKPQNCTFEKSDTNKKECVIMDFSDNALTGTNTTYTQLTFKKPGNTNTSATSVVKDKYYLIKLTDEISVHGFTHLKMYTNDSTSPNAKIIEFTDPKPAIYIGSNDYIFIVD